MNKKIVIIWGACFFPVIGLGGDVDFDEDLVNEITIGTSPWNLKIHRNGIGVISAGSSTRSEIKGGVFDFPSLVKRLSSSSLKSEEISDFHNKGKSNYVSVSFWKDGQTSSTAVYVKNEQAIDIFQKALENAMGGGGWEPNYTRVLQRHPPLGLKIERERFSRKEFDEQAEFMKKIRSGQIDKIVKSGERTGSVQYKRKDGVKRNDEENNVVIEKPVQREESRNLLLWIGGVLGLIFLAILVRVKLRKV